MLLTDGITFLLAVAGQQLGILAVIDQAGCMSHVEVTPYAVSTFEGVVHAKFQLVTLGGHLTQVGRRCFLSEVSRYRTYIASDDDVATLILEEFERAGKHATEERIIDTDIQLANNFPMDIGIAYLRFAIELVVALAIAVVHTGSIARKVLPGGEIEEASAVRVITDFAIRYTELHHIEELLVEQLEVGDTLHPRLIGDHPAEGSRIEECETIVWSELFRAVVGTVVFGEVAVGKIIGHTESPVLTVAGDHQTCSTLVAGEYAHGADVMTTELACPVELQLIVEITIGVPVVDTTIVGGPGHGGHFVKVVGSIVAVLILDDTCLRIDPLVARCRLIEVVDASVGLTEGVVP